MAISFRLQIDLIESLFYLINSSQQSVLVRIITITVDLIIIQAQPVILVRNRQAQYLSHLLLQVMVAMTISPQQSLEQQITMEIKHLALRQQLVAFALHVFGGQCSLEKFFSLLRGYSSQRKRSFLYLAFLEEQLLQHLLILSSFFSIEDTLVQKEI